MTGENREQGRRERGLCLRIGRGKDKILLWIERRQTWPLGKWQFIKGKVLAFLVDSASQLPGDSQVCLTHYKRGCHSLPLFLPSLPLLFPSPPTPFPCVPGQSLLLPFTSAFLCLYSLNSPLHGLNKLYSILYRPVACPSGGRDVSAWAHRGTPFCLTIP